MISLDDDQSIHTIWRDRLTSVTDQGDKVKVLQFTSPETFKETYRTMEPDEISRTRILVDYEFSGQDMTGLDFIESLNLSTQSILVTSHHEEPHVLSRCEKLGVRIAPKALAGLVPIRIQRKDNSCDAILIVTDSLIRLT